MGERRNGDTCGVMPVHEMGSRKTGKMGETKIKITKEALCKTGDMINNENR